MSKLVRESLNEEFFENFILSSHTYNIEVYKNPRSIKRLNPDIRGIADDYGNLYIVNDPRVIHENIIYYLRDIKKVIPRTAGWDNDIGTFRKIVAWTRFYDTNIFALSESYLDTELLTSAEWDLIYESTKRAQKKNPSIEFKFKTVSEIQKEDTK